MQGVKIVLDLHEIAHSGHAIERALLAVMQEARDKKAPMVEIIPGKGTGALKKTVLRFLDRPEIKVQYQRVQKESKNHGRLFVHFRW